MDSKAARSLALEKEACHERTYPTVGVTYSDPEVCGTE